MSVMSANGKRFARRLASATIRSCWISWWNRIIVWYLRNCRIARWRKHRRWRRRIDHLASLRFYVFIQVFNMDWHIVENNKIFDGQWLFSLDFPGFVQGCGTRGEFCRRAGAILAFCCFDLIGYRLYVILVIAKIATIARHEPHVQAIFQHVQDREHDIGIEEALSCILIIECGISQTQQKWRKVEEDSSDITVALCIAFQPVQLHRTH